MMGVAFLGSFHLPHLLMTLLCTVGCASFGGCGELTLEEILKDDATWKHSLSITICKNSVLHIGLKCHTAYSYIYRVSCMISETTQDFMRQIVLYPP